MPIKDRISASFYILTAKINICISKIYNRKAKKMNVKARNYIRNAKHISIKKINYYGKLVDAYIFKADMYLYRATRDHEVVRAIIDRNKVVKNTDPLMENTL